MADNLNGATTAIFVVALSVAVTEPIDVEWSTKDGTGKAGIDYEAANGVLTFQPGETEKQIQVLVYGRDETAGSSEKTFYIAISPANNAIVGTALVNCTITVTDSEGTPVTSVVVAQGRRGLRGDPGRSAYEQAVLQGYTGTVQQWMDEIGDAAQAAQRAESAANTAAAQANAQILPNVTAAQTAATTASQKALEAQNVVDSAYTSSDHAFGTLAEAQAAVGSIPANKEIKVLKDPDANKNGSYFWDGTTLEPADYNPVLMFTGDAYFNGNITLADLSNTGFYFLFIWGDYVNKLNGAKILPDPNGRYTDLIKVAKDTVISGTIWRFLGIHNVAYFDQNKQFVGFLDTPPSSGAAIAPISITVENDGYVSIQQFASNQPVALQFTAKTRLLNKDDRDTVDGYVSKEYVEQNYYPTPFKDITELYKKLCDVNSIRFDENLNPVAASNFFASKPVKFYPGVTLNVQKYYLGNFVTTALFIFYDKDMQVLDSVVYGNQGDNNNRIVRYLDIKSPDNTAFMKTCYAWDYNGTIGIPTDGVTLYPSDLKISLKMDLAGQQYYDYLSGGKYKFDVFGDSLGQGIEFALHTAIADTYVINGTSIGGENVQDSLFRRSLNHVTVKTKGLSVPNTGATVSCSGWFDFDEAFTFNADGSYSVSAIDVSNIYDAARNARSDFDFTYKGQALRFNMTAKTIKQIDPLGSGSVTFDQDLILSMNQPVLNNFAVVMMGTNGGFVKSTDPNNTVAAMNNLIECFKRIYDQYAGRVIFCGYHGARVDVRAYYRREMKRQFGEKFIDLPTFLMGYGRHILKIDAFNQQEVNFMSTYQGVTSDSGNSFLPVFSGDNTHPRSIVNAAFGNEILRRAYQLGFIDKLYQAPISAPTALSISGTNTLVVGANVTLTAAFTAGYVDASLFTWSSSNTAVATVSNENWLTSWGNSAGITSVITGVATGSAVITCKARYGGATATFTVNVS